MPRLLIVGAVVYLSAAAAASTTYSAPAQSAQSAHADIVTAQGQKIGTAMLHPSGSGVRIDVQISQLPPGTHGIHIHNVGNVRVRLSPAPAGISIRRRRNTGKTILKDHTPVTC